MTYRLASQTSGFNGDRRAPEPPFDQQKVPREERMFTVKGKVSSLEISDGSVDPVHGYQRRQYGDADIMQIDTFGTQKSYAKRLAVQHFGCHIGERVVVGTFPAVGFKNGDAVKAVVTNHDGDGVFAHAVMTTANGKLWLPHAVCKGTHASLIGLAKKAALLAAIGWACALLLILAWPPKSGVLAAASLAGLAILAAGALVVFFINRASTQGPYADKILTMLGFINPKTVNLSPFSERARGANSFDQPGSLHVYELWPALAAHGAIKRKKKVRPVK
jgi:hypothetical protein